MRIEDALQTMQIAHFPIAKAPLDHHVFPFHASLMVFGIFLANVNTNVMFSVN